MSDGNKSEVALLKDEIEALKLEKAELQEKLKEHNKCLRCNRDNSAAKISVKEDELKAYLRAMLGQVPYSKTLSFYDGTLNFVFTELPGNLVNRQYAKIKTSTSSDDYLTIAETTLLVGSLTKIFTDDPQTGETTVIYEASQEQRLEKLNNPIESREEINSKLNQVQTILLRKACEVFGQLVSELVEAALNENFYEGAGLV